MFLFFSVAFKIFRKIFSQLSPLFSFARKNTFFFTVILKRIEEFHRLNVCIFKYVTVFSFPSSFELLLKEKPGETRQKRVSVLASISFLQANANKQK